MPRMARDLISANAFGDPFPAVGFGASQTLAFSSTAAQNGTAFNAETTLLRLIATGANCRVEFGSDPTAAATSHILIEGEEYYVRIDAGMKLSAIRADDTDGVLNITECE